jgi:hypothetical protein
MLSEMKVVEQRELSDNFDLFLLQRWESRAKYDKYLEWAMAQSGTRESMS